MKIAILGIRGVPAKYGGLETCGEEIGSRLAARGHEVFCYCRTGTEDDDLASYRGIRRINLPSLKFSATDTYSHSLLAFLHVLGQKPDVILAFNPGIGTLCVIPKLFGYPVALNPDGFDWRRAKWSWFARQFIYRSAWAAAKLCDQLIIDARSVADFYQEAFACDPIYIPNGAVVDPHSQNPEILEEYGLEKDGYFLFLSRHVPDNSCAMVIEAFEGLDTDKKLVFGGGNDSDPAYVESLQRTKDERIIFPGPVFDSQHVKELHHGAYAVINGNQPGGTSLGLLKALGFGTCVLVLNTPDNSFVVEDSAMTFELSAEDLRAQMAYALEHPERVAELRERALTRCRENYSWDLLADRYEEVLKRIAGVDA